MSLKIKDKEHRGLDNVVDLVFADPFYGPKWQPTATDHITLRRLFDAVSKDHTVFIIFGRVDMLFTHWVPIFDKGLAGSKINYKIQSSLFHLVRSQARDRFTNNNFTWHSMCENALTVIRMPSEKTRASKRGKNSVPLERSQKAGAIFKANMAKMAFRAKCFRL